MDRKELIEALEKRMLALKSKEEEMVASVNRLQGAQRESFFWLRQMQEMQKMEDAGIPIPKKVDGKIVLEPPPKAHGALESQPATNPTPESEGYGGSPKYEGSPQPGEAGS